MSVHECSHCGRFILVLLFWRFFYVGLLTKSVFRDYCLFLFGFLVILLFQRCRPILIIGLTFGICLGMFRSKLLAQTPAAQNRKNVFAMKTVTTSPPGRFACGFFNRYIEASNTGSWGVLVVDLQNAQLCDGFFEQGDKQVMQQCNKQWSR